MANKREQNTKVQAEKGRKIAFIVCILLILFLLGIIIVLIKGNGTASEEETRRNVVVNPSNAESVAEQMVEEAIEYVEPGYYTVCMDTEWHFADGAAISENARVDNLSENTNDIYFDVFLAEDESEAIYQSPVIPRGGYLENIALGTPLEQGTYDCVIVYHLIDEEQNTISTLRVAFQIIIES